MDLIIQINKYETAINQPVDYMFKRNDGLLLTTIIKYIKYFRMKNIHYVAFLLVILLVYSCELVTDYKLNKDIAIDVNLLEYIKAGKDPNLTLFLEAVTLAELEKEFIETNKDKTRIVPDNDAMRQLLSIAGVQQLSDIPKPIIRNLMLYCIFPGNIKSYDLKINEMLGFVSDNGDSIYISREVSGTDEYALFINKASSMAVPIKVIRQDYIFPEGVAQIVSTFPLPTKPKKATDRIPDSFEYDEAVRDTLWVSADAHLYQGNGGNGFNYDKSNRLVSRANVLRYTYMKFNLSDLGIEDISLASFNINVLKTEGTNWEPEIGLYQTQSDWPVDNTFTWNNYADKLNFEEFIVSHRLLIKTGWQKMDITPFLSNYLSNPLSNSVLGFGLKLINGADVPLSNIEIGWYDEKNEVSISRSYIECIGNVNLMSELQLVNHTPLISSGKVTILTRENVLMKAESSQYADVVYTDNNILYKVEELPTKGILVKNGIPLSQSATFTQEELGQNIIKYFPTGTDTDSFKLRVQDYLGGMYKDIITIAIQ